MIAARITGHAMMSWSAVSTSTRKTRDSVGGSCTDYYISNPVEPGVRLPPLRPAAQIMPLSRVAAAYAPCSDDDHAGDEERPTADMRSYSVAHDSWQRSSDMPRLRIS